MDWGGFGPYILPAVNFIVLALFMPFLASQRGHRKDLNDKVDQMRQELNDRVDKAFERSDQKHNLLNERIDAILRNNATRHHWDSTKGC